MAETAQHLLGPSQTEDYVPSAYWGRYYVLRKAPPFSLSVGLEMLTDPRITLGLWLIKGPILSKTRFFVDCDRQDVKEFIKTQLTRFWRMSAVKAMKAIEWGYAPSEVLYRPLNGMIHYDTLKDLHPLDCRAVTQKGKLVGATVRNVPNATGRRKVQIEGARLLWTVHSRETHPWYGRSRLFGAYLPWIELWTEGGCRDTRRLYFHKYAFTGPIGYHPAGELTMADGLKVSARDLMREMLEKYKVGAVMTFPNTRDAQGQLAWNVVPPNVSAPPQQIMDYIADLRTEILEGLGIPPEVIETQGGTTGWSGKAIPMEAFYSILQDIVNWLTHDFSNQILRPLIEINFGKGIDFEIVPFGLSFAPSTPSDQAAAGQQATPGGQSDGVALSGPEIVTFEPPTGYKPKHRRKYRATGVALSLPNDELANLWPIGWAAIERTQNEQPVDDNPPVAMAIENLTIEPEEIDIPKLAEDVGVDIDGIDVAQIRMGLDVEQEHAGNKGGDTKIAFTLGDALKIAVAHLRENPVYYDDLKKMEDAAKARAA